MLRTHTCGELTIADIGKQVTLCGWIQKTRDLGGMTFIDLRDRYGITQIVFNMDVNPELCKEARNLSREYVICAKGIVAERSNKNHKIPTGDIEIIVEKFSILNESKIPPFTIEDESDGGEELRMKYRYLDLRRKPLQKNIELRHKISINVRNYLNNLNFIEIETPVLIKSTPEGARDFVVPSRMHPGEFYALPQSPQTFKQILMISGFDRYFQIVKCFRDEDLRADRQPEFTQIDCEMSFINQEDILNIFENLIKYLFKNIKNIDINDFPRLTYDEAMKYYGSDKPDIRFDMKIVDLEENLIKKHGFKVFDDAEFVAGICAQGCANYSRKQIDELTDFVKKPQLGANGLIFIKLINNEIKSSIDKFFSPEDLHKISYKFNAKEGDLILLIAGQKEKTQKALCELRLELGKRLNLIKDNTFAPLWVIDFPMFEWDEETNRFYAKHHPFTSPKEEDIALLETNQNIVRANAYDLVINGVEIGGGSIRIHKKSLQKQIFKLLGFDEETANKQFGFLMDAFEYGAPPHGGIALGLDRLCAVFSNADSIRDFIAFPKNNAARDIMAEAPSFISQEQLKELKIKLDI
jgi:aspartyl-tRNA synthetase